MSFAFLLSLCFLAPYAAHAASTLATASVIPPFHNMVPPEDLNYKGARHGGGNASLGKEVLNLNLNQPVMPNQWCCAVNEITDLNLKYNTLFHTLVAKNQSLLDPALDQNGSLNHTQHGVHHFHLSFHNGSPPFLISFESSMHIHGEGAASAHALARVGMPVQALCDVVRLYTSVPLVRPPNVSLVHWALAWLLDALIRVQMLLLGSICLPLVYAPLVLLYAGGFAVIIDVAKAAVGLTILVTGLGSHRLKSHIIMIRVLAYIDRICLKMIIVCDRLLCSPMCKMCFIVLGAYCLIPSAEATGRETPKVTFQDYFLPGVTRWDGYPYHDFRRVWWVALCAALGNVSQEGWSLLQTARDQDLGAPGNPGTPAQTVQSNNRNERLFGAILNYVEATSHLYYFVSTTFANDGRGLFQYLHVAGHLPYTNEERVSLDSEWKEATMASVGIKYTPKAVFEWANYVNVLASKLGKNEMEKRVKYLAGFPSSFDVLIIAERARPIGSYLHPAVYPVHHPQAGNPHPLVGQPDTDATASAFYGEWARMCNEGLIKAIPKGFARRAASSDDDSDDEQACRTFTPTPTTVCLVCGGLGHGAKSSVGECLTAKLGHRVPREHLNQIKYPEGYNPPRSIWLAEPGHPKHALNRRPFMRSGKDHNRAHYSNPAPVPSPPSRPYGGKARMSDATMFDDPPHDEPLSPGEEEFANRLQREFHQRRRNYRRDPKRTTRPPPRPRARLTEAPPPPSQETPQNSAQEAYESYHESDDAEQGRLAVATGNITFNV